MSEPREVILAVDGKSLPGLLDVPANCRGLVVFAHGSGSSRLSPRNLSVAAALHSAGFGTLLFDLLESKEAADRSNVFDIGLLSHRLLTVTEWLRARTDCSGLPIGWFGASTGAAAALAAAADAHADVSAIVSRGGRPDLAEAALPLVQAPTLLIVGSEDKEVLALNREAAADLRCPHEVRVIDGATHLFEEPGTLEQVALLAGDWFARHLT